MCSDACLTSPCADSSLRTWSHRTVAQVVAHVRERYPRSTLYAAGWSLGANIMVNYLAEQVRR